MAKRPETVVFKKDGTEITINLDEKMPGDHPKYPNKARYSTPDAEGCVLDRKEFRFLAVPDLVSEAA